MGDSEYAPTTCEKRDLVDNGVIGTGLYGTSVQSGLGSLALRFADALADVPSSVDEDKRFCLCVQVPQVQVGDSVDDGVKSSE
jgi:hypothetical protein